MYYLQLDVLCEVRRVIEKKFQKLDRDVGLGRLVLDARLTVEVLTERSSVAPPPLSVRHKRQAEVMARAAQPC